MRLEPTRLTETDRFRVDAGMSPLSHDTPRDRAPKLPIETSASRNRLSTVIGTVEL